MFVEVIKQFTIWLATVTELIAGLVIAIAVIEAALRAAMVIRYSSSHPPDSSHEAKEEVRLRLGRWLALALEFELGADILRTAIAPTWSEIGQLAAIAAIRTALNFSFSKKSIRLLCVALLPSKALRSLVSGRSLRSQMGSSFRRNPQPRITNWASISTSGEKRV